jgi:hypothetical protein
MLLSKLAAYSYDGIRAETAMKIDGMKLENEHTNVTDKIIVVVKETHFMFN